MKRLVLMLAMLSPLALAQEDPFDLSVVDKLRERERKVLDKILEAKRADYNLSERESLKVQVADILSSPTFLGHILKGEKLVDLETDEQVILNEDINVRAHSLADKSGYLYLQNNDGGATYKTLAANVSNIEEVTQMREPPLKYAPVVKRKVERTVDKDFSFFTELNLHLGLTSPKFTRDLVNDDTSNSGRAIRYELQAYSEFALPFSVGGNLMIESVNGDIGNGESYSASALSFGPLLKSPEVEIFGLALRGTLGARSSVFSRVQEARSADGASYRLAQTSLFLGAQKDARLALGEFVVGASFQRQWSKASSDGYSADLDFESTYDDSFSISFGHKMGWL